jgi:hypothetical protein
MGMLSSVLPGVRDVRTPLVTGYAWLIALWLLFADWNPAQRAGAQLRSVFSPLTTSLGSGPILALVTVVAYLFGGLLVGDPNRTPFLPSLNRVLAHPLELLRNLDANSRSDLRKPLREAGRSRRYRDIDTYRLGSHFIRRDITDDADVEPAKEAIMGFDHTSAAVRLQIANKDLWDQYDRFRAEAELRFSLAPAVVAIAVGLAARMPFWTSVVAILAAWAMVTG